MTYEFTALPIDELLNRLLKSGFDADCYGKMSEDLYPIAEAKLKSREYVSLPKNDKPKSLRRLAEDCADDVTKFDTYDWEDVVLETVSALKLPSKWYSYIFGHVDEEKGLYPAIKKFLKKEYESVYDTSSVRSKLVRFADFTVTKREFLSGNKIISFDAKTKPSAFDHFLNQASDFQRFSNYVYLIATPGLILEAGKKYGRPAFAQTKVEKKLEELGVGLYVIDLTANDMRLLLESEERGTEKEAKNNAIRELNLIK